MKNKTVKMVQKSAKFLFLFFFAYFFPFIVQSDTVMGSSQKWFGKTKKSYVSAPSLASLKSFHRLP